MFIARRGSERNQRKKGVIKLANKRNLSFTAGRERRSIETATVFLLLALGTMTCTTIVCAPMTLLAQSPANPSAEEAQVPPRPGVVGQREE